MCASASYIVKAIQVFCCLCFSFHCIHQKECPPVNPLTTLLSLASGYQHIIESPNLDIIFFVCTVL